MIPTTRMMIQSSSLSSFKKSSSTTAAKLLFKDTCIHRSFAATSSLLSSHVDNGNKFQYRNRHGHNDHRYYHDTATLNSLNINTSITSNNSSVAVGSRSVSGIGSELADHCHHYVVSSPHRPIPKGPYLPLFEFITQQWEKQPTSSATSTTKSSPKDSITTELSSSKRVPMDKIAIVDGSTGLQRTFYDYHRTATSLAAALKYDMHVKEVTGTVAFFCPNHVDYLSVCLGVSLCGAKITPINPLYTYHELSTILHRSRSSVLVTHSSKLDIAIKAVQDNEHVKHIIVVTDDDGITTDTATSMIEDDRIISLNSIRNHPRALDGSVLELHHGDTSLHPYCIPYSSGTTGLPKGVCLSHGNIVANLLQYHTVEHSDNGGLLQSHDSIISPLPFFHIYAFTASMLYAAWRGNTLITTSQRFDIEQFCALVQDYKPTRAHLVPPIILGLEKHPIIDSYDLSSLNMIVSAAAPMSAGTELAVQKRLYGTCQIKQAWGMSELSPLGTMNSDKTIRPGSIGQLVSSTFGKIIDPVSGKSLGPDIPGELVLKGPQVMMGYLDDPDKTAECLSESGWLRTGDVATYDTDGYFYITDRIKELIKVNGFQVAPAELEALLITHPNIVDAAVIPIPDDSAGELPRAYVVLKDQSISEGNNNNTNDANDIERIKEEIFAWVKERVAPYKRLNGGIVIQSSIPKSASGKILRRILKDEYNASIGSTSN